MREGDVVRIKGESMEDFYKIIGTERRPNGDMLIMDGDGNHRKVPRSRIVVVIQKEEAE